MRLHWRALALQRPAAHLHLTAPSNRLALDGTIPPPSFFLSRLRPLDSSHSDVGVLQPATHLHFACLSTRPTRSSRSFHHQPPPDNKDNSPEQPTITSPIHPQRWDRRLVAPARNQLSLHSFDLCSAGSWYPGLGHRHHDHQHLRRHHHHREPLHFGVPFILTIETSLRPSLPTTGSDQTPPNKGRPTGHLDRLHRLDSCNPDLLFTRTATTPVEAARARACIDFELQPSHHRAHRQG